MVEFFLPDEIVADELDVSGDADIGGDLTLSGDSPVFTMGSGLGSPDQVVNKEDAGTYTKQYQNVGVTRWSDFFDSVEDMNLRRHNGAGVVQDSIKYDVATGLTTYPNDVLVDRGPAKITVGTATGEANVVINKNDVGSQSGVDHQNLSVLRWREGMDATENFGLHRFDGAGVFQETTIQASQAVAVVTVDGAVNVGDGTNGEVNITGAAGWAALRLNKANGFEAAFEIKDGGVSRWDWPRVDAAENLLVKRFNAAGAFQDQVVVREADGDWEFPANVDLAGNLFLNSAAATATIGAGTGTAYANIDKSDAGNASVRYSNVGVLRWESIAFGNEDFGLARRYNASAVLQGTTIVRQDNGNIVTEAGLGVGGDPTGIANLYVVAPGIPVIAKIGDGSGDARAILDKDGAATGTLQFQSDSVLRWQLLSGSAEDLKVERFNSSGVFQGTPWKILAGSDDVEIEDNLDVGGNLNMTGDVLGAGIDIGAVAAEIGTLHATDATAINGFRAGNETSLAGSFLSGSGVPGAGIGSDGDLYLRTDGGSGTTLYQKRVGAWVATGA